MCLYHWCIATTRMTMTSKSVFMHKFKLVQKYIPAGHISWSKHRLKKIVTVVIIKCIGSNDIWIYSSEFFFTRIRGFEKCLLYTCENTRVTHAFSYVYIWHFPNPRILMKNSEKILSCDHILYHFGGSKTVKVISKLFEIKNALHSNRRTLNY